MNFISLPLIPRQDVGHESTCSAVRAGLLGGTLDGVGDVTGQVKPGGGDRWGRRAGWLVGTEGASPHPGEVELSTLMGRQQEMLVEGESAHAALGGRGLDGESPALGEWKARFKKEGTGAK